MAKHSNLADVALAGLASKENFRKVKLRNVKSTDVVTNNSAPPFNKLMLIRIKGQKKQQNLIIDVMNGDLSFSFLNIIKKMVPQKEECIDLYQ